MRALRRATRVQLKASSMVDMRHDCAESDVDRAERRAMLASLARFQGPEMRRSVVPLASTLLAYALTVVSMYIALQFSVWLAVAMSIPAAGLVVRLFIIQHDCGHGSYFHTSRTRGSSRGTRPSMTRAADGAGGGAQGRIWRLSRRRWIKPAPPVQDPGALICSLAGDGLLEPGTYARRCVGDHRYARYRFRRNRPLIVKP